MVTQMLNCYRQNPQNIFVLFGSSRDYDGQKEGLYVTLADG